MNIQNQNTPDGFSTMDKHDLTDADQARSALWITTRASVGQQHKADEESNLVSLIYRKT